MACFRGLRNYRRKDGSSNDHYPEVFYLHVIFNGRISTDHLPLRGFLDECETIHFEQEKKSTKTIVTYVLAASLFATLFFLQSISNIKGALATSQRRSQSN